MGNLLAPRWLTVATGIIAVIILALNVKLLFDTFIASGLLLH
jgi:Mn2+/Fe2+ NRAMP family transporter